MKAHIDDDRCRGHGVCTTVCPQVFALNDDGYAEVILDEVPDDLADSAREAVAACPENAITLG
ncbi:ferredoxin [Mycobacterium sp. NBC_00419]|uniref:ferredoxin n=1 Tax=Mycobacterium sp. NBC_00419 TaxID=2975989 RepID=UPI002E1A828A